uniref:CSON003859 protein n=1 Tax=Culicoides sonorensis TaxID=179676 RepID=A0A336LDP0_CULSO
MSLLEKTSSSWKHDFIEVARESGFKFKQQHSGVSAAAFFDWKEIDSVDVDQIISDRDFHAVDRLLPHLMEAPIGSLIHNRILDPNIRKYLQLTQVALQYLLFCKKFLDKTVCGLRSTINDTSKDNSKLGRILKRKNQEIIALQTKIRDVQKNCEENFPCMQCSKNFDSFKHVSDHIKKKHLDGECNTQKDSSPVSTPVSDKSLISTIKLELEVKQLKERLNVAEKELHEQKISQFNINNANKQQIQTFSNHTPSTYDAGVQVTDELIKTDTQKTQIDTKKSNSNDLNVVKEEIVSVNKLNDMLREQTKMIEKLRENERNSYKTELDDLRSGFKEAFLSLKGSIDSKLSHIENIQRELNEIESKNDEGSKSNNKFPKFDDKNIIEENLCKISHIDEVLREEHEHWETRFKKLERIFEKNQELMSNNLKSLSQTYSTKFTTLEKTIKDSSKQQHEMTQSEPVLTNIDYVRSYEMRQPHQSETLIKQKLSEKTPSFKVVQPLMNINKGAIPKSNVKQNPKPVKHEKIKDQKPPIKQKPVTKPPSKIESKKIPEIKIDNSAETQLDIFTTFCSRLKKYGIKNTSKSLSTPQMLAIKSQLVQERLKIKKKNSLFASIRSKLNTKVEKEAKIRLESLKKDDRYLKENSSSDIFECTNKHSNEIEDIIEENLSQSSSSDSEEIVVVVPFKKLPTVAEGSESNSKSLQNTTKISLGHESNCSTFKKSDPAMTSTKIEDQLRRVLDSPIHKPTFPTQHIIKAQLESKSGQSTPITKKRLTILGTKKEPKTWE